MRFRSNTFANNTHKIKTKTAQVRLIVSNPKGEVIYTSTKERILLIIPFNIKDAVYMTNVYFPYSEILRIVLKFSICLNNEIKNMLTTHPVSNLIVNAFIELIFISNESKGDLYTELPTSQ